MNYFLQKKDLQTIFVMRKSQHFNQDCNTQIVNRFSPNFNCLPWQLYGYVLSQKDGLIAKSQLQVFYLSSRILSSSVASQKHQCTELFTVDCKVLLEKMWYNSVGSLFKDVYLNTRF